MVLSIAYDVLPLDDSFSASHGYFSLERKT